MCCVQSVYSMCKGCVQCMLGVHGAVCVCVCAVCTVCVCVCGVYSVHSVYGQCVQSICSMYCVYSLHTACVQHVLHVQCVYISYMSRAYVQCESVVVQENLISNSALIVRTVCTVCKVRGQSVLCVQVEAQHEGIMESTVDPTRAEA